MWFLQAYSHVSEIDSKQANENKLLYMMVRAIKGNKQDTVIEVSMERMGGSMDFQWEPLWTGVIYTEA